MKSPHELSPRASSAKRFDSKEEALKYHKIAEIPEHFEPITEKDYARRLIDLLFSEDSLDPMDRQCRWAALALNMDTEGGTMLRRVEEFVNKMKMLSHIYHAGGV